MKFKSLEDVFEYLRMNQLKSVLPDTESSAKSDAEGDSDYCTDRQLAELESKETLLLANVNVAILDVMMNTLNQESAIRNEQADTLVKLAQVKSILGNC